MRTGFTAQSLAEYAKLRKAMAVWDKYDRSSANTAHKKCEKALMKLKEAIKDLI